MELYCYRREFDLTIHKDYHVAKSK